MKTTWTLKSGRRIRQRADDLTLMPNGRLAYGYDGYASLEPEVYDEPLTKEERLEVAAEVKACWDRWAETGEP
jgi:hypothetical protein